jgi:hypothetical protein
MKHNLEMIVDQPMAGHFYWTIVEVGQAGEAHRVVAHAPGPLPTCSTATGAGLVAGRGAGRAAHHASGGEARSLAQR